MLAQTERVWLWQTASRLGDFLFDLKQFLFLYSVSALCCSRSIIYLSFSLGGRSALSGLGLQAEQVNWGSMHEKPFQSTGRRFCWARLFMSTSWWSTLMKQVMWSLSLELFWTSMASTDSASFWALQHSASPPPATRSIVQNGSWCSQDMLSHHHCSCFNAKAKRGGWDVQEQDCFA